MRKLLCFGTVCSACVLSACAAHKTPEAPPLRGAVVEPLNPTKWNHAGAVRARQEALAKQEASAILPATFK